MNEKPATRNPQLGTRKPETKVMEPKTILENVTRKLDFVLPHAVVESGMDYDFPVIVVKKEKLHDVLEYLRDEVSAGFKFLTTLCCTHFPENPGGEFCMMYQLHNLRENKRLRIKSFTSEEDVVFPSVMDIFPTANWMEREAYDFYGMKFTGHPNLKRILNVDYMESFPMRKEFPMEDATRHDKDDEMFGR